jgi:uncharacterized membrane protein
MEAGMRVEESIYIERPADEVFAFFDDRRNDGRWMAAVHESEWIDPGERTAIGRRGRMVMDAMGTREFTDVVTAYEPGQAVGHRSDGGSLVLNTGCIVQPEGTGCRASVWLEPERLPGGMFGPLIAPFVARHVRRMYRQDLERLKAILESRDLAGDLL